MFAYNIMLALLNVLLLVIAYFAIRKVHHWLTGKEEPRPATPKKEKDLW
jgi:hypothetical protein